MNSIGAATKKQIISRLKQFSPILFSIVLITISLVHFSLPLVGSWLVREDHIHKVDAIAVLCGSFPQRAEEAADLYHSGYAPEIWLTRPAKRSDKNQFGKPVNYSEDMRNFELLRFLGVPQGAIHVLEMPIVNTADEMNAIDSGLKETGNSSVIIVTNKAHTRRVFSLWDKYHFGEGEVLVHAVSDDSFVASQWWKSRSSRSQGIHELLGMLDLWAGLPVHRPLQMNASNRATTQTSLP